MNRHVQVDYVRKVDILAPNVLLRGLQLPCVYELRQFALQAEPRRDGLRDVMPVPIVSFIHAQPLVLLLSKIEGTGAAGLAALIIVLSLASVFPHAVRAVADVVSGCGHHQQLLIVFDVAEVLVCVLGLSLLLLLGGCGYCLLLLELNVFLQHGLHLTFLLLLFLLLPLLLPVLLFFFYLFP